MPAEWPQAVAAGSEGSGGFNELRRSASTCCFWRGQLEPLWLGGAADRILAHANNQILLGFGDDKWIVFCLRVSHFWFQGLDWPCQESIMPNRPQFHSFESAEKMLSVKLACYALVRGVKWRRSVSFKWNPLLNVVHDCVCKCDRKSIIWAVRAAILDSFWVIALKCQRRKLDRELLRDGEGFTFSA